jgi:hypothetical protein
MDEAKVSDDYGEDMGMVEEQLQYTVKKPNRFELFRVRPDDPGAGKDAAKRWHVVLWLLKYKLDPNDLQDKIYAVGGNVPQLRKEARAHIHYLCMNEHGVVFLWPIPFDAASNAWNETKLKAAKLAMRDWIPRQRHRVKTGPLTVPDEFHILCGRLKNSSCKFYEFCLNYVLALDFANWVCINCPHRHSFRYVTHGEIIGSLQLAAYLFRGMRNDMHPPSIAERKAGVKIIKCITKESSLEPTYQLRTHGRYQPRYLETALHEQEVIE